MSIGLARSCLLASTLGHVQVVDAGLHNGRSNYRNEGPGSLAKTSRVRVSVASQKLCLNANLGHLRLPVKRSAIAAPIPASVLFQ
jgi:hypothetical protein